MLNNTQARGCMTAAGAAILMLSMACTRAPAVNVSAGTPVDGNSFMVRNVRVFDGRRAIEGVNVVVRNGQIASVGRSASAAGLPVIDGSGRTLLPGLIDAHGHVASETSTRDALRFGVTTVLDMLSPIAAVRAQKAQRSLVERTNRADLWTAGHPATSPQGLGTQFGIPFSTISAPDEAVAFVKGRVADGSDYIKILYEPGAPLFTTISRETLAALVGAAHAEGVLAVAHISSLRGAREAVSAGVDGLAHSLSDSLIDETLAKEIAAKKIFVTTTLTIIGGFSGKPIGPSLAADSRLSPYLRPPQRTALTKAGPGPQDPMAPYLARFDVDRAIRNVGRMNAAGVRLLAGTDAPNLGSHGVSLHGELELLTKAGLSPAQALTAATFAPAEAFRLADRGRIAAGARADLILVDGNPLQDIRQTRAIVRVFKNGFEMSRALPQ